MALLRTCPRCGTIRNAVTGRPGRVRIVPIICGLAVVLAVILFLLLYVWPGLLRTPVSTVIVPITDAVVVLPDDANFFMGADVEQLRKAGLVEPGLAFLAKPPKNLPALREAVPPSALELARDMESILIAGSAGSERGRPIVILTMKGPVDVEKVKKACNAGESLQIHGQTVYRANVTGKEKDTLAWLAFPGERLVIITKTTEPQFRNMLAPGRSPHPARALIDEAKHGAIWAAAYIDEAVREDIETQAPKMFKQLLVPPNIFEPLVPLLVRQRGGFMHLTFPDKGEPEAQFHGVCTSDADAVALVKECQNLWEATDGVREVAPLGLVFVSPVLGKLVEDINGTTTFRAEGTHAIARAQLSAKTLQAFRQLKPAEK